MHCLSFFYYLTEESTRADEWEIPREKLHTFRTIGEGAFGVVMEGVLDSGNCVFNYILKLM